MSSTGYKSVKGKGFVQPNALLAAAETTSGVVLTASGTIRITGNSSANKSNGSDSLSFSNLGSVGAAGAGTGVRRGRGANGSAPISAQSETVKIAASKSRTDIVEVPYSSRVWRNVVLQYTEGKYVDQTPLTILGVAAADVGGVKGLEPYFAPPVNSSETKPAAYAKKGPYTAKIEDLFGAAVQLFQEKKNSYAPSHTSSSAETQLIGGDALLEAADAAEQSEMKYLTSHRKMRRDDDSDSDEDGDGTITLPMLKPPMARPAAVNNMAGGKKTTDSTGPSTAVGPTMSMVMNHTISGNMKFTYTDYDGVTSAAIVPIIKVAGAASSSSAPEGTAANSDDDDDDGPVQMDGEGEAVSAYTNPNAKSNRKYFIKKAELAEGERAIFDKLWTLWRNSFVQKGSVASKTANSSATATAVDTPTFGNGSGRSNIGSKRTRDNDDIEIRGERDGRAKAVRAFLPSNGGPEVNKDSTADQPAGQVLSEDEEIARMIRATEEELAALQREMF